jgi:hypothetical protein
VAWPYSEVDETERAVSAGRYGTGTVLIPPFREYLRSRLEEPPVGREGETALEPSGRWEREPTLYLPSAI